MLVLTFLHDRWYVSWLVLTVSGGACNVSSIQYTARIPVYPGGIQPVPQYVECGVSCLCPAPPPHPCTTRQPLAGRLAKMNSPGCRVLCGWAACRAEAWYLVLPLQWTQEPCGDMNYSIQTDSLSKPHQINQSFSAVVSTALVLMLAGNMTRSTGALLLLLITVTGAAQIILPPSPPPPWRLSNGGAGEASTFYEIETIWRSAHSQRLRLCGDLKLFLSRVNFHYLNLFICLLAGNIG